jgi:hypothetical protein
MLARRLSRIAIVLALPGIGAAAACGSSSNPNSPDAGGGGSDSGTTSDVSVQDTGVAMMEAGPSDAGAPEAASDGACPPPPTGAFTEATHAPLPTVVYFGGNVIPAPQVVDFTFPTTSNVAALQAYSQTITRTPWFSDVSKDYCVADGGPCITPGPTGISVPITTAADATYVDNFGGAVTGGTDLQAFMNTQIAAAVTAKTIPAPSANSLYIFYFPPGIVIQTPAMQTQSCQGFSGYHYHMLYSDGKTPIYYAIVPDCSSAGSTRELSSMEIAASHEIIEATTDPEPDNGFLGWYLDVPTEADAAVTTNQFRNDPWTNLQFGEVGDNCESVSLHTWPLDDAGNVAQRIWSASAATAGHNPCVPVPAGETYYNVSSDKAIYVANVGDTFTVDISAFSDVARAAWKLEAEDDTPTQTPAGAGSMNPLPYLSFKFVNGYNSQPDGGGVAELACVNNGTTGQLMVTLLADPDTDTTLGAAANQMWPEAVGALYSVDTSNPQTRKGRDGGTITSYPYQFWPFAVVTPTTAAANGIPAAGVKDVHQLANWRSRRLVNGQRSRFAPPPWLEP